jgi:hypothetical protein
VKSDPDAVARYRSEILVFLSLAIRHRSTPDDVESDIRDSDRNVSSRGGHRETAPSMPVT